MTVSSQQAEKSAPSMNPLCPPLCHGKSPAETRVVVAMSGGVDSSVVAAWLHDLGYDVIGVTLQLYDHGLALAKKGACCAGQDIYDAARVAEMVGFPHYVLDYESRFKQDVIDEFADSYLRGDTPIPCVRCNQTVKFRDLLKVAQDLDADVLATGHYIQTKIDENGKNCLYRARDHQKDQSYFLFATTQEQLDFLRFPLGGFSKDVTRQLAEKYKLIVADKPDSQDICFVPDGKYADLVQKLRPGAIDPGDIVHVNGQIMGQHQGIIHYTIGQRKGLGIGGQKGGDGSPLYVIRLDPEKKQVIVGPREALACQDVYVTDVNWLGVLDQDVVDMPIQVKLRSVQQAQPAFLTLLPDQRAKVTLADKTYGIASGQACVFYKEEQVLGGGWITRKTLEV